MSMAMWGRDRLIVAVHHATAPTDAEWQSWLALCQQRAGKELRGFVESYDSGGPSPSQRRALASAIRGQDTRSAILTGSVIERGAVTAIAWLGVRVRAFALDQHRLAAEYLQLSDAEFSLVMGALTTLRRECGCSDASNTSSKAK